MTDRRLFLLAAGIVALASAAHLSRVAADDKDAVKKEKAALLGEWVPVSLHVKGVENKDPKALADFSMKITDTQVIQGTAKKVVMTYTLDPSKDPKHIDISYVEGAPMPCIYELKKNRLKLLMAADFKRPSKFESEGRKVLIIYSRKSKKSD
jgi:uncharacterized protein (TIGR03067 family)